MSFISCVELVSNINLESKRNLTEFVCMHTFVILVGFQNSFVSKKKEFMSLK